MKSRKRDARNYEVMRHEWAMLRKAKGEDQRRIISKLSAHDGLMLDADFEAWAHRNQLPPNGEGWRVWLMMAGRGFGKTRAGAEWIFRLASGKAGLRIALAGASIADARSVMIEGVSGLLTVARRYRRRLNWEPSLGRLKWPNGSQAQLFSGDHADGFRGPEHDFAWCDELAKWREAEEAWMNLQFGLRRGQRPRALVTTTPRPIELLRRMDADATVRSLSPEGWASRVAIVAARWNASLMVAEANNGGAMVESVLKAADCGLKVRLGCLDAAIAAATVHNGAAKWNKALLDNAARPSGALSYEPADGSALSAEQFARLKDELAREFSGSGNAGRPMLLEGGLKWQALSLTPADMDFVALKETSSNCA